MKELKKGAVSLAGAPECPPASLHYKSLPGQGTPMPDSAPQSFHTKKDGAMGGDLRPAKYRADQVLSGAGK